MARYIERKISYFTVCRKMGLPIIRKTIPESEESLVRKWNALIKKLTSIKVFRLSCERYRWWKCWSI